MEREIVGSLRIVSICWVTAEEKSSTRTLLSLHNLNRREAREVADLVVPILQRNHFFDGDGAIEASFSPYPEYLFRASL